MARTVGVRSRGQRRLHVGHASKLRVVPPTRCVLDGRNVHAFHHFLWLLARERHLSGTVAKGYPPVLRATRTAVKSRQVYVGRRAVQHLACSSCSWVCSLLLSQPAGLPPGSPEGCCSVQASSICRVCKRTSAHPAASACSSASLWSASAAAAARVFASCVHGGAVLRSCAVQELQKHLWLPSMH
jgi:hypothetical protein